MTERWSIINRLKLHRSNQLETSQQQIIKSGVEKALNRIHKFSAEQVEMVIGSTENRLIKKRELILVPGQVCSFVVIVISGSLRLFNETDEKENTLNLFCEYDFAADHESFVSQKPSVNSIEALEDTLICLISIHQLHALIGRSHAFFCHWPGNGKLDKGYDPCHQF